MLYTHFMDWSKMKRAILQPNGSVEIVSRTDEEISEHDAVESKVAAYKKSVEDAHAI